MPAMPISLAKSYASSTYLPPFTTTLPMEVPQFTSWRKFYKPYGRGLGAVFEPSSAEIRSRPPIVPRADPTIGLMDQITFGMGEFSSIPHATYYRPWTSLRPSRGPLLGLGQDVFRADIEWWAKAAGTALLTFAGLYILAKL